MSHSYNGSSRLVQMEYGVWIMEDETTWNMMEREPRISANTCAHLVNQTVRVRSFSCRRCAAVRPAISTQTDHHFVNNGRS